MEKNEDKEIQQYFDFMNGNEGVHFVVVEKPDMDIILDMLREYRNDLQNMRDDQHAWNEVRIKGNEQMWEDEMAMAARLLEKYEN